MAKQAQAGELRTRIYIRRLEKEDTAIVATVGEVRKAAILEEVYRLGGSVAPETISDLARKYGRDPSACGGYYSGKAPSLKAAIASGAGLQALRQLTDTGRQSVQDTRAAWGEDWLDRIPMDIVGSQRAADTEISF